MTATPDTIPTDLTLELGENLTPERFLAATRAFFGYVREVAYVLAPERELPKWVVVVREGSALLAVSPAPNADGRVIQSIYSRAEEAIRHLDGGEIAGSGLSEAALKHLVALSDLAGSYGPRSRASPVRMWIRRRPVEVGANIARVVRDDWRIDYNDFGTIEGRLETIQDKDGNLQMQVRDATFRQTVRCHFPEEMLTDAFNNFRKRVDVSGTVHYRKNGTPVSIEVAAIEKLPADDELPTANDVRGLLRLDPPP
ncbi:MAG: hypothetical protein JO264_17155 [Acidisphaera sp.]|nr:hypothetical protein [Acidisphaera sp.]